MGLPLAVAGIKPAGAVTLAARELASLAGAFAGGACLPIELVGGAADYAGAALADGQLSALAADHFRRIGEGSAAGAYGNRLWL